MYSTDAVEDGDQYEPKFSLSQGTGTRLGDMACFTAVPRGKKTKELEAALEPLHRFVYNRPGVGGQRKAALEDFKGFPADMEAEVKEKLGRLSKDKLRSLVLALEMRVKVSQPIALLADDVLAFLMKPKGAEKREVAGKKRERSASAPAARPAARARTEGDAEAGAQPRVSPQRPRAAPQPTGPSEDAVRVQVYRRVLAMTPEERANLGVKQLRTELEAFFGVDSGELKCFRDAVTETASDCVRALMDAEARARAEPPAEAEQPAEEPADAE